MICENCNIEHDGSYGSGRFCSSKCARGFSTKTKRKEINEKVSKIMSQKISNGLKIGCIEKNNDNVVKTKCVICGRKYITRQYSWGKLRKTCSSKCATKLRIKSYNENDMKNVGGYRKGSGRGKSGWYMGYWCDSSYELAFVIFNIEHDIKFQRNKNGFNYFWENKQHTYYPDFIIENKYYEIKGYETNQDKVKYKSVNKPIIVLYKKNLSEIIHYVENKYGKDYIKLYMGNPYNKLKNKCVVCRKSCKNIYCSRECAGRGNNRNSKYKNYGEIV